MGEDRESLVAAAAAGDRGAWEAIVTLFAGLVWGVARSFRLSAADAADVSQVTWLRLVENLDRIRSPEALGSWLATTARRESITLLRRRQELPLPEPDRVEAADDQQPPPWLPLLVDERNRELWAAFRQLPTRCQELLRLLVLEPEGSYATVAAALDLPVGSLGPTRARCLEALRRHLRAHNHEGDGGT
jgi:RNA polymerase sigma factor (sigma-70 family)